MTYAAISIASVTLSARAAPVGPMPARALGSRPMIRLRGRLRSTMIGPISVVSAEPRWPTASTASTLRWNRGGTRRRNRPDELAGVLLSVGDRLPLRAGLIGPPGERDRLGRQVKIAGPPGDRDLAGVDARADLRRLELDGRRCAVDLDP